MSRDESKTVVTR